LVVVGHGDADGAQEQPVEQVTGHRLRRCWPACGHVAKWLLYRSGGSIPGSVIVSSTRHSGADPPLEVRPTWPVRMMLPSSAGWGSRGMGLPAVVTAHKIGASQVRQATG